MTRAYGLFSALIIFVAVLNIVMIGRLFNGLSAPALWFIGTNFMGMLLGLLNFFRIRANKRDWFITWKSIAANAVCLAFYILLAARLSTGRTWTVAAVAALLLITSILWKPSEEKSE